MILHLTLDTSSVLFRRTFIVTAIVASCICFGLAAYAATWTGPTGTAPNNNVAAPINVGTASQIKDGPLSVNGFLSTPGNIRVVNGVSDITLGNNGGWTGINMYHGSARGYIQVDSTGIYIDPYTNTSDKVTILGSLCLGGTCKTSLAPSCTTRTNTCNATHGQSCVASCASDETMTGGGGQSSYDYNVACTPSGNGFQCQHWAGGPGRYATLYTYARCCK